MARIVDPYNLDVDDDDALFAGALCQGLIWIEDDDDEYDDDFERVVSRKSEVEQLESSSQRQVNIIKSHKYKINKAVVTGEYVISASDDKTLHVSNWKTGEHIRTLKGHRASVNSVVVSGNFAISASSDKSVRVWNWNTGEYIRAITDYVYPVTHLDIYDDVIAVIASAKLGREYVNEISVYNWQTGELLHKISGLHLTQIKSVAIQGNLILTLSTKLLLVNNWQTGEIIHEVNLDDYMRDEILDDYMRNEILVNKEFVIFANFDYVKVFRWQVGEFADQTYLNDKQNTAINAQVFPIISGIFMYGLQKSKWHRYHVDYAYDKVIALVDDYSHMITTDYGGWIYVVRMNPSLKHLITNNQQFSIKETILYHYSITDVLQIVREYIDKRKEEWVNLSYVSQHLQQTIPNFNVKTLGKPHKTYRSLVKLFADYSDDFELQPDSEKQGLYWIRLK